jgi:hypothetical protein
MSNLSGATHIGSVRNPAQKRQPSDHDALDLVEGTDFATIFVRSATELTKSAVKRCARNVNDSSER